MREVRIGGGPLSRPARELAPELLGCELVRAGGEPRCRVRIVETEAYEEDDPASHSRNGPTPRSRVMFGSPGRWYIYRCYGIHWMINLVCGTEGSGEAVLIRAGEPLGGTKRMKRRRGRGGRALTNGPGKLAEALGVDRTLNGRSATLESGLGLRPGTEPTTVYESPRIGIREGDRRLWRFFTDSQFVSRASQNENCRRRD